MIERAGDMTIWLLSHPFPALLFGLALAAPAMANILTRRERNTRCERRSPSP